MRAESNDRARANSHNLAQKSGARSSKHRTRVDPTRMQGALVISDETRTAMERCELFQDLDREQLMAVAALVEERDFEPEEAFIREGEAAKYIYIVAKGRAVAQLKLDHGWLSLGLVGPGEAAGWTSLIDGKVHPASVSALTPVLAARIESAGLGLLMNLEPQIGYPVHKRLSAIFCRQYEAALRTIRTAG